MFSTASKTLVFLTNVPKFGNTISKTPVQNVFNHVSLLGLPMPL